MPGLGSDLSSFDENQQERYQRPRLWTIVGDHPANDSKFDGISLVDAMDVTKVK